MTKIEKYKIITFNSVQASLVYRFQFFTGIFILVVPFIIKNCLWKLAFISSTTGMINGYTYNEILVYNIFSMVFSYLNMTYIQYNIALEIKDGMLSRYLVKPIDHQLYWLSMLIGDKIINMVYVLLFISISGVLLGNKIGNSIMTYNILLTIIAVLFSVILNFLLYYVISLLAFWFLEISSFFAAVMFVISILSGEVIPINVMPIFIGKILMVLPFSYSVYFPVQIIMAEVTLHEILLKFVAQFIWIMLISIIGRLVWNRGIRKYSAVGG